MESDLIPKILEYRILEEDTPELVLDYHTTHGSIDLGIIAGAIEAVIGVEYVDVSNGGKKMKVVARDTSRVYSEIRSLFEKVYGVLPKRSWSGVVEWLR